MTDRESESPVEKIKRNSHHLRGTLVESLEAGGAGFSTEEAQLLKFHGTYQQESRDLRRKRVEGEAKRHSFMIRVALPGGVATADQYLAFDDLAEKYADGTIRVTTRQGLQYHGILKSNLKASIAEINHSLATTLAACGDVLRNVMACPAPLDQPGHRAALDAARAIAAELRPASRAYHEIWLDGERVVSDQPEEPFYGDVYLPRKFKVAVALDSHNCVDIASQDVGLVGIHEGDAIVAFNVLVGGGLGMTHGKGDTLARLADPLGSVAPAHAAAAVRIVAAIFRDHGNRADRRHARLKYLIHEWGLDRFREEFRRRADFPLDPPRDIPVPPFADHLEPHRDDRGIWTYGIFVQSGRIADQGNQRLRTAIREIVERLRPAIHFTGQQNLLLHGLDDAGVAQVEGILAGHGVTAATELAAARRFSLACPALPTCGLAVAESERLMPSVVERLEATLDSLGVRDVPITVRMTGCPNGCARPYTADLAFVGRSLGLYHVYVGGGLDADRVADLYHADVKVDALLDTVEPLLRRWAAERESHEGLGDFYQRLRGNGAARRQLTGREKPTAESVREPVG